MNQYSIENMKFELGRFYRKQIRRPIWNFYEYIGQKIENNIDKKSVQMGLELYEKTYELLFETEFTIKLNFKKKTEEKLEDKLTTTSIKHK